MRAGTWIVALVVLSPGAVAATLDADLTFGEPPTLAGAAQVRAAWGALEMDPGAPWRIHVEGAEGWLVTQALHYAGAPGGPSAFTGGEVRNETMRLPAGTLHSIECVGWCDALLLADGAGALVLSGAADGVLAPLAAPRVHAFGDAEAPRQDSFLYKVAAGWTAAGGAGLPLASPLAWASGDLTLFLMDASVRMDASDGPRVLDARRTSEPSSGPLGVPTGRTDEARFLLLHLRGARLDPVPAGSSALLAPEPAVALDGRLASPRATGTVLVDGERHDLVDEAFSARGDLDAAPRGDAPALVPLAAAASGARVTGEASEVMVGAAAVARAATGTAAAAVGLSLAAALGVVAAWKLGLWSWLYTRLAPATLLTNPNRRRVHEAVNERPGSTVADLVRALGMTEVVVRHHLRILETHGFVVAHGEGKRRGFHPPGRADSLRAEVYLTLRDETRRRIAWTLAEARAPLSQQEIAAHVGVSSRLVSYHLGRLESDGLVEGSGSMPRRYAPSARLAAYRAAEPEGSAA